MTASMSKFNVWYGHFQRQQWECHVTASSVPYHKPYQVRDTIITLVRSKSSPPPTNDLPRPPAVMNRDKKKRGGGVAGVRVATLG